MPRKHFTALQLHRNLTNTTQNTALLKTHLEEQRRIFWFQDEATSATTQTLFSYQLNPSNAPFRLSPRLTTNKSIKEGIKSMQRNHQTIYIKQKEGNTHNRLHNIIASECGEGRKIQAV